MFAFFISCIDASAEATLRACKRPAFIILDISKTPASRDPGSGRYLHDSNYIAISAKALIHREKGKGISDGKKIFLDYAGLKVQNGGLEYNCY